MKTVTGRNEGCYYEKMHEFAMLLCDLKYTLLHLIYIIHYSILLLIRALSKLPKYIHTITYVILQIGKDIQGVH